MNVIKYISICLAMVVSQNIFCQELRLTKEECREMALRNSEDLKKAINATHQSDLDRKIAKTAYLPKIDGSASGLYMAPDIDMMGAKMQNKGTYMAVCNLSSPYMRVAR